MTTETTEEEAPVASEGVDRWYGIWLPRIAAAVLVIAAFWFGSQWAFTSLTDFIFTLILTLFMGFALLPAVDWLSERQGWRRGLAAMVVMLGTGLIALVFAFAIFNVFITQVIELIDELPGTVDKVVVYLNDTFSLEIDASELDLEAGSVEEFLAGPGGQILGGVLGLAGTVLGMVFRLLTVALFLFYLLADMPRFRATMLSRLSPERQITADTVTQITIDKVGGYIYSRGLLAAISATFHFIVFILIGLPYPLALALWVGIVSQFIPTIGTYLAGVVPVVIGLLSDDPIDGVLVLIAILIYQQIENYFIANRVTKNTMELHPAVAFGSAIVGGSLLGGIGALLALPAAATVIALVDTYTNRQEIIESEKFESPEEYEARLAERRAEKERRKAEKKAQESRFIRRRKAPEPLADD
jgi:predicted PurR-regulated permease PerM